LGRLNWTPPPNGNPDPNHHNWQEFRAFLAVADHAGADPVPMPPPSPYFDWKVYRSFLQEPNVAVRNTHRVIVSGGILRLACRFAGAPDRSLDFSFEVIRRMSPAVGVELLASVGFNALLHQRRPWIERREPPNPPGPWGLSLPPQRRLSFGRIRMPAKASDSGGFRLTGVSALRNGDSLAIRQLYRGEEVGRVTWLFET
jgi:hypothetical protein